MKRGKEGEEEERGVQRKVKIKELKKSMKKIVMKRLGVS